MPWKVFQRGKFGQREKTLTVLLAAAVVWMLGYRTLLQPRRAQLRKVTGTVTALDNELTKLEAQRPDLNAKREHLEAIRKQIAQLFGELERLEEGLLNRQDLDVVLEQISTKPSRLRVQINAVKPLKDEPRKGADRDRAKPEEAFYKRLFVQVDCYGGFDDLIAYITMLEAHSPYQRVNDILIKIEGQDLVRPRALVLMETLLANTPEQQQERRADIFGAIEQLAAQQSKDPFLAKEKPKEEQLAAGLELTGVFGKGAALTALINGEPYHVGDAIQGKRIIAIHPDRIVLEQGSRRFLIYGAQGAER